jgi:hypothetical protein
MASTRAEAVAHSKGADVRKTLIVLVVDVGLVLTSAMALSAQDPPKSIKVTMNISGSPLSGMDLVLQLVDKGKVRAGTTNANGEIALDLATLPKVRFEVSEEECPDPEGSHVLMTQPGAKPDDRCKRRSIGFWTWGNGTELFIDTGAGTLKVMGGEPTDGKPR